MPTRHRGEGARGLDAQVAVQRAVQGAAVHQYGSVRVQEATKCRWQFRGRCTCDSSGGNCNISNKPRISHITHHEFPDSQHRRT
jgi:hypothetical protein